MSDVTALQLAKWSGIVASQLIKDSVITDDMTYVRDLNDAEDSVVAVVSTNVAKEVAKDSDRSAVTSVADSDRRLTHNKSIEAGDTVHYREDQTKIPYNLIEEKMPLLGQQAAVAHARRFFAYGVGTTSNFGGLVTTGPNHIITGDFTTANSALNTLILNSLLNTRTLLVNQGVFVNPDDVFVAFAPSIWARLHTIPEVKGHEYHWRESMGGVNRTKVFEYLDMSLMETPAGLGEDMTSTEFVDATHTPTKFKIDLSSYVAFAWVRTGYAQGFAEGGKGDAKTGMPKRHAVTRVNDHWEKRRWVIDISMIYDVLYIYDNSDTNESLLGVAWKSTV